MSDIENSSNTSNVDKSHWNFYDELLKSEVIEPFIDCMTCGKCVGDCIAAENSDFNFRSILQKVLDGDKEQLMNGDAIWKCFLCGLCTIKCPKNIEIKKLILILRRLANKSGKGYNFLKYISDLPELFLKKGLIVLQLNEPLREKLGLPKEYNLSEKTLKELDQILEETGQKKTILNFLKRTKEEFMKSITSGE